MHEHFVPSTAKAPGRRTWVLDGPGEAPTWLLVFLDAELYLERVGAATVVQELERDGHIPPTTSIFVSSNGASSRHADYVCDPDHSRFLVDDVLPFALSRHPSLAPERVVLVGLSLSGLAAAHAALTTGRFRAAVCQSPSFWWQHERFAASLSSAGGQSAAFWVSVGDLETESGVTHPPSGLVQGTSQRDSCERSAAALQAAGFTVSHRVFHGGHDPACWRDDLALALPWATSV